MPAINPLRILWITLALVCTQTLAQPTAESINKIKALVEATYNKDEPGAVVLVAHKDNIVYHQAIGQSSLEGPPLQLDTIFRIASVSKQFTAVAILQLAEQGKLNLDDHINKFVPEFDTRDQKITVKMLLNHTSGIISYTSMPNFDQGIDSTDVTPEELVDFFNNQELQFTPGTDQSYSNSGYALLGLIIERVSGVSYAQYMHQNIFKKANMQRVFAGDDHAGTKGFATGYIATDTGYTETGYISLTWPYAAGCIETTTADLHRWIRALHKEKIISQASLNEASAPTILPSGQRISYGYGLDTLNIQGHPTVEHGGGIPGFVSHLLYIPDKEITVAILSNAMRPGLTAFAAKIAAHAINNPYPENPSIELGQSTLQEYIGTYTDQNNNTRIISISDNKLFSQRVGGMGLFLLPIAKDRFIMQDQLIQIQFIRDESTNTVTKLNFIDRTGESIWTRSLD
ncbi:MAG: beta-lactamase family protein [Phycisphaerales bacterium]|nr:beta-lactamase family protein [Phycisphaerales bacterium]